MVGVVLADLAQLIYESLTSIARYIEEELGCNPQIQGSTSAAKSRLCKSRIQLQHLSNISEALEIMDASGIYKTTGCIAPCKKNKYQSVPMEMEFTKGPEGGFQYVSMFITIENGLFEEREEYLIYDWDSFISDIGGYIGLLLGSSLYSLYQDMAVMVGRMWSKIMSTTRAVETVQ